MFSTIGPTVLCRDYNSKSKLSSVTSIRGDSEANHLRPNPAVSACSNHRSSRLPMLTELKV